MNFAIKLHSNLHFVSEFSCGFDANVTSNPLVIQSPLYPNDFYPNSVFCEWNIMSSTPGYKILVDLIDFDTESCCDQLEVSQSVVKRCTCVYTSILSNIMHNNVFRFCLNYSNSFRLFFTFCLLQLLSFSLY